MKVIIMGCGRVGEQLCRLLSAEGHQVTVIDPNAAALDRLGPEFKGRKIKGVGFDRDVLLQAGIATADAFAAASASDNANILAARIARNIFSVPRVVARSIRPAPGGDIRATGLAHHFFHHLGRRTDCGDVGPHRIRPLIEFRKW